MTNQNVGRAARAVKALKDERPPARLADETQPPPDDPFPLRPPLPTLGRAAFQGIAGRIVRLIEPQTEADPAGVLLQLLAAIGSAIGRGAWFQVEADRHHCNFFVANIGATSTGRKGTSWGRVRQVMELAAPDWCQANVFGGLQSAEGLIHNVRDKRTRRVGDGPEEVLDEGADVKTALVVETELGSVLKRMSKQGNTLSAVLRQAWDGHMLSNLSKHSPGKATGAHISVIGHVTEADVDSLLSKTELLNGFGNRFLWSYVRRSKELPFGGADIRAELAPLAEELKGAILWAARAGVVAWTRPAAKQWQEKYKKLTEGRPGLCGAITGRATAQVVRLAMLYALLDSKNEIGTAHLSAALAVWSYCEASAVRVFGSQEDDSSTQLAAELLAKLKEVAGSGLTRKEIRDAYSRHKSAEELGEALSLLLDQGKVVREERKTNGRPAEVWKGKQKGVPATEATEATEGQNAYETRHSSASEPATEVATEGGSVATEGGSDLEDDPAGDDHEGRLRSHDGDFGRNFGRNGAHAETPEKQANGTSVASVASVAGTPFQGEELDL